MFTTNTSNAEREHESHNDGTDVHKYHLSLESCKSRETGPTPRTLIFISVPGAMGGSLRGVTYLNYVHFVSNLGTDVCFMSCCDLDEKRDKIIDWDTESNSYCLFIFDDDFVTRKRFFRDENKVLCIKTNGCIKYLDYEQSFYMLCWFYYNFKKGCMHLDTIDTLSWDLYSQHFSVHEGHLVDFFEYSERLKRREEEVFKSIALVPGGCGGACPVAHRA